MVRAKCNSAPGLNSDVNWNQGAAPQPNRDVAFFRKRKSFHPIGDENIRLVGAFPLRLEAQTRRLPLEENIGKASKSGVIG